MDIFQKNFQKLEGLLYIFVSFNSCPVIYIFAHSTPCVLKIHESLIDCCRLIFVPTCTTDVLVCQQIHTQIIIYCPNSSVSISSICHLTASLILAQRNVWIFPLTWVVNVSPWVKGIGCVGHYPTHRLGSYELSSLIR